MLLYTTQRSGRAGRRRHGCERRRELRVEVRRRGGRRDQRAERVGVRGVVTAFPSTKVSGHWSKLRAVRLRLSFNDYASQALFRRVAETTNLAPFVKQALTHDEAIHRKPDLPRGK